MIGDEITISDLSCACELAQCKAFDIDLSKFPRTKAWLERVLSIPEVAQVHKEIIPQIKQFAQSQDLSPAPKL